ncbi:MAG: peptidylprolyl isomerase [Candidatus Marinimicrobia bacterium]|nr:peptidylprolyl isomerase [Candidatus Neomarinimicrobiota bacterium]
MTGQNHKCGACIRLLLGLFVLALGSGRALALEDGLYAVFETSLGSFTGRLDYVAAPLTVANFVGLAEGAQEWMEVDTGAVRTTPFYDGIIFHRVITNFMIQAGSRNQQGTDGPGYRFPDEIPNGLRHDAAGKLSMANSGFDSNGSQFFITLAPTAWLDGKHTVFGQITDGMDIVAAIGAVTTDDADRPLEDVVIESVEILRIGVAAENFQPDGWLPRAAYALIAGLRVEPDQHVLNVAQQVFGQYNLRVSFDLNAWTAYTYPLRTTEPPPGELAIGGTEGLRRLFYGVTEWTYPGNAYPLPTPHNKTFQFDFTGPAWVAGMYVDYVFDDQGEGSMTSNVTDPGAILGFYHEVLGYPNRAMLLVAASNIGRIDYRLQFTSATGGTFSGIINVAEYATNEAVGVFTVTDNSPPE